ncbi:MAG TPA: aminotransferase class V-fold PLP-dependent enzyme [Candidatus Acidoferrum sp.]|nr:aminotransferase class V-fold PLP-dependent enzyme [Candidatus Acidoferrum sp.]
MDYRREFADFEGVAYLNIANQGPLPLASARASQAAIEAKKLPHRISDNLYFDLPDRVREKIARLIGAVPDEIAVTTGASAGLAAVAAGIDWQPGDEVLVARDEFPAHLAAWLPYENAGKLRVRVLTPRGRFISAEDYVEHIGPRTRVVSASLVRYNDGARLDAARVAQACHAANAALLLDISQCAGAVPMSVRDLRADFAVSSAYKWLLGPYGTGFFWVAREWTDRLRCGPLYWQALEGARDFHSLTLGNLRAAAGARRWDSPETASFVQLAALDASLEFLLKVGTEAIAAHNDALMSEIIDRLPRDRCALATPAERDRRGPYVCVAARKPEKTAQLLEQLREAQIIVSLRENALRISSHLYNTPEHVERLVKVLSAS